MEKICVECGEDDIVQLVYLNGDILCQECIDCGGLEGEQSPVCPDVSESSLNVLLSCPFCGPSKFLSLYEATADHELKGMWRVGCGSCGIRTFKRSKEEATTFWNTRAR